MTFKKRRRLLYPTGLISLALLPLAIFCYIQKKQIFQQLHVMEVIWWDKKDPVHLNGHVQPWTRPDRCFTELKLTGHRIEDDIKLRFASIKIRELVNTNDLSSGVHFYFANSATYATLVKALDICTIENAKMYLAEGNDIWVFNPDPRKPESIDKRPLPGYRMICGNSLLSIVEEDIDNQNSMPTAASAYWPVFGLFLSLIMLSGFSLYKMKI